MSAQHWYWVCAGAAMLVAVIAGVADVRRSRRDQLDRIGWVPWRGIQVTAVFAGLLLLSMGLRLG